MDTNQIQASFLQRLKQAADREGKSVKTFVMDAINDYSAREQAKAEQSIPPNQSPNS